MARRPRSLVIGNSLRAQPSDSGSRVRGWRGRCFASFWPWDALFATDLSDSVFILQGTAVRAAVPSLLLLRHFS